MSLHDDLRQAASPPPPSGFTPGIRYSGGKPDEVTTPWLEEELPGDGDYSEVAAKMGVTLPPGHVLVLVEARFNQAAWHRDAADRREKDTAYTAPAWIYRFKVVPAYAAGKVDEDIAAMVAEAKRRRPTRAITKMKGTAGTAIINLADFQLGKVDELGGTPETLARSEVALAAKVAWLRKMKPQHIVLADNGDSTEGFESAPGADRTNDLSQVEQIRVWRRVFWRWVDEISRLGAPMDVVSVPSNHCSVRRGKNKMGHHDDDWGLEVLSQIADMASVNPAAYEHVNFLVPNKFERHVTLTLHGKIVVFEHGDSRGGPNTLTGWAKSHGRRDIGVADILIVGHHHHFRCTAYGDGQYLFVCPTNDNGSSWFTPQSGEKAEPGVLSFMVDEHGWRDLDICWTAP